jgi:hypothetical protein
MRGRLSRRDLGFRHYPLLGVSGTLEVAGLAWWGSGLVLMIHRGRHAACDAPPPAGGRPARIEGRHLVAEVLDWFPEAESVLVRHGFLAIRQPLLRRSLARRVTIAQAAALRGIAAATLLDALNAAVAGERRGPKPVGCMAEPPLVQIEAKP